MVYMSMLVVLGVTLIVCLLVVNASNVLLFFVSIVASAVANELDLRSFDIALSILAAVRRHLPVRLRGGVDEREDHIQCARRDGLAPLLTWPSSSP